MVAYQTETWNRQELYEKVSRFPLRKLAAEYRISDVGLAKVCRKLDIPLPGLGHWTKIAYGHAILRPPLPAMETVPALMRQVREPQAPPTLSSTCSFPLAPRTERGVSSFRSSEKHLSLSKDSLIVFPESTPSVERCRRSP